MSDVFVFIHSFIKEHLSNKCSFIVVLVIILAFTFCRMIDLECKYKLQQKDNEIQSREFKYEKKYSRLIDSLTDIIREKDNKIRECHLKQIGDSIVISHLKLQLDVKNEK